MAALDTSPEGGIVDFFLSFDLVQSSAKAAELFVEGIKKRNGGTVPQASSSKFSGIRRICSAMPAPKALIPFSRNIPSSKSPRERANGQHGFPCGRLGSSDQVRKRGSRNLRPDSGHYGTGVVAAIEAAGLNAADFGISGICIGPEGIDLIKKGKCSGVAQPAYDAAALAVQYLVDKLRGNPVPQIGDTVVVEGALWSPAKVIRNPWADDGAFVVLQGPSFPGGQPR